MNNYITFTYEQLKTVSEMADLCEYLGMNAEEYLGKEAASLPRQESSYNI